MRSCSLIKVNFKSHINLFQNSFSFFQTNKFTITMSTIFKIINSLLLSKEKINKLQTYLIKHKQKKEILHSALMSPLKIDKNKLELLKEFLKTSVGTIYLNKIIV